MMKKSVFYFITLIVVCFLLGCATAKPVPQVVHDTHTDTLYLNRTQYDSVFVNNYRLVDRGRDTLLIQDAKVEYRYRLLHDTVRVHQVDSIPVIQTVEVTKLQPFVPVYYKWALAASAILLLLLYVHQKLKS